MNPPHVLTTRGLSRAGNRQGRTLSVAELRECDEVKGLIARGRQVGVLTYAEVGDATAELDLEEADVQGLARHA
jgi:hypothetical protein